MGEDSTTVPLSSPVDSYRMNVPVESWDFYTGRRIQTENNLTFDLLTKRSPIHILRFHLAQVLAQPSFFLEKLVL